MKKMESTNLNEIVAVIKEGKLLLPDFQRGFVWDLEKQKGLVASVLAKMPLGSILELEAKADDYGCRILGRQDDVQVEKGKEQEVFVLLDGQQRLTSLINVFSNLIYYDYENPSTLISEYKRVLSLKLLHRFFLRIPAAWKETKGKEINDWFGVKELKMNIGSGEKDIPPFLTKDISPWIHTEKITKKCTEPYVPHSHKPQDIVKYAKKEDEYWIPLYLLIEENENSDVNKNRLQDILDDIVEDTVKYYVREEYRKISGRQEKIHYIEQHIAADHIKDVLESEDVEEAFKSNWILEGKRSWSDRMVAYLKGCIERMDMHEIVVEQSQRERAIDIYENLNLGGVTLSTFELILAKAAKKKFKNNGNLYDAVVKIIQTPMKYNEKLLSEISEKHFKRLLEEEKEYAVLETFECYNEKKNILNKKFTEVFLNVLTLISKVPDYNPESIEAGLIKRSTTLKLDENDICNNYEAVCKGIGRACFFLQARCGIRKINELNYNLMLVVLSYLLAEDRYCEDEKIIKQLEVWYWLAVFSGRYDKDQSENTISDIRNFLISIQKKDNYQWMKGWEKTFFNMPGFSDEETLLMKGDEPPKKVIKDTICQFYMSVTYPDMLNDKITIQPFWTLGHKLEEHHIVPIGSLKSTYKKCAQEIRKSKKNIANSPLNYVYITEKSNKEISSRLLSDYIKEVTAGSRYKLKINVEKMDSINEECVTEFLKSRFESTKEAIAERINSIACWEERLNVENK